MLNYIAWISLGALRLSDDSTLLEKASFQLTGFLVVMIALSMLWAAIEGISKIAGWFDRHMLKREVAKASSNYNLGSTPNKIPETIKEVDSELVAIIAAAVAAAIGGPHQIASIELVPDARHLPAWAQEGRRQIYSSHKIR